MNGQGGYRGEPPQRTNFNPMHDEYLAHLRRTVDAIRADGFYKAERVIESPQSSQILLSSGAEVLNFCANNYLGLANDPRLMAAAREGLEHWGFGMASVRFICGTQAVHKELEAGDFRVPRNRRQHPLFELLRCQRRRVRNTARRRGRGHQRRIESCQHRRRHPLVQGEALALSQQRHGRPRGQAERSRSRGRALQADRDRRRVLDGRDRRRLEGDLRTRRPAWRAGAGR